MQAGEAGLKGFQLIEQQKGEAIAEFVRKYGENEEAISAIDAIYNAKEKAAIAQQQKQWDDLADKTLEDYARMQDAQDAFTQRVKEMVDEQRVHGATGPAA